MQGTDCGLSLLACLLHADRRSLIYPYLIVYILLCALIEYLLILIASPVPYLGLKESIFLVLPFLHGIPSQCSLDELVTSHPLFLKYPSKLGLLVSGRLPFEVVMEVPAELSLMRE